MAERPKLKLLRKANAFVGERLQLAMDTLIDITKTTTESFEPLKKHKPEVIVKFLEGQKRLFRRRKEIRERLLT